METTQRFGLPLLVFGQGQKDITHNEAVMGIDWLLHGRIVSAGLRRPPAAPAVGDAWLVGTPAEAEWLGHDGQMACFSAGGWRFFRPAAGLALWNAELGRCQRFDGTDWRFDPRPTMTAPVRPQLQGGSVIDAEARQALLVILARLVELGIFADG
ncbi:DUF2793 domain-containing protein [Thermaurantiacus sp.]